MSRRWLNERRRDYYYRKAKKENYRSRAAFKLIQINEKFHIIKERDTVLDLGADPGGWSQVAAGLVGGGGRVVAIDLKPMRPIDGVEVVRGDVRSEETRKRIAELLGGKADVLVSDMAPNISGNYSLDHARSMELAGMALVYADRFLRRGGCMVVKVFDGDMAGELFREMDSRFRIAKRHSPKASRRSSSEVYFIGINYISK